MIGITFNGKHSYNDYNLILSSKKIGTPAKKKIKDSVPGMNSSYDFSTIASSGEIVYEQRVIEIKFTLISVNRNKLLVDLSKVYEWLLGAGQKQLIFDDMRDYYFLAEAEDSIETEISNKTAVISVKFIAEPFKYSVEYVGSDVWDTFNFEEDMVQVVEFDVVDSLTVNIYNPGRVVVPTINVNALMGIVLNGYVATLNPGDNIDYGFKLQPGNSSIFIASSGHIKFIFRKVML